MSEPKVHCLSVPNPYFEGTNSVYLIEGDPPTLIDSGMCFDAAGDVLKEHLRKLGYSYADIGQIVLTHKHVDHVGQAAAIRDASGAEVYIHEDDHAEVTAMDAGHGKFVANIRRLLHAWKAPAEDVESLASSMETNGWQPRSVPARKLVHGDRISVGNDNLEVIHAPGHTRGCICLRMNRHIFTGDAVLRDLSPNVGGGDLNRVGLLAAFFDSLERVAALDEPGVVAMPGHGEPFSGLADRCRELIAHHRQRLDQIMTVLADGRPHTVYELAHKLFGTMRHIHLMLGTAEIFSHVEYLAEQGSVVLHDGTVCKR